MQSAMPKRIGAWLNTRILRIQDLSKPSNPIGERFASYAIRQAEAELEHWLYFLGEDECSSG